MVARTESADPPARRSADIVRSRRARRPLDLSRDVLVDVARDVQRDLVRQQTSLVSAGIAFRGFLALFPSLIVVVTALALAQPAADIEYQSRRLTIGLPALGRQVILNQVESITKADNGGLRIAFVVSLLLAGWAATSALQGTLIALSTTQGEVENRSWLDQRLLASKLTAGAVPFIVVSVVVITGVPVVVRRLGLGSIAEVMGVLGTLVVLALMMVSALTVLYRYGPCRRAARLRWASAGAVVATVLWLVGTEAFKLLVENVGTYDARYGAVAGAAVIMLWLWLTTWCLLFGAVVNARLEHQTAVDSTIGPARPLGERGAVPADTHPDRPMPDGTSPAADREAPAASVPAEGEPLPPGGPA